MPRKSAKRISELERTLKRLTVPVLRERLEKVGEDMTGTKPVLIKRLLLALQPRIELTPERRQRIKNHSRNPGMLLPLPDDVLLKINGYVKEGQWREKAVARVQERLQNDDPNYLPFDIDYEVLFEKLNIQDEDDLFTKFSSTGKFGRNFGGQVYQILHDKLFLPYLGIKSSIDGTEATIVTLIEANEDDNEIEDDEFEAELERHSGELGKNITELNDNLKEYASYGITMKEDEKKKIQKKVTELNEDLRNLKKTNHIIRVNLGDESSTKNKRSSSGRHGRSAESKRSPTTRIASPTVSSSPRSTREPTEPPTPSASSKR